MPKASDGAFFSPEELTTLSTGLGLASEQLRALSEKLSRAKQAHLDLDALKTAYFGLLLIPENAALKKYTSMAEELGDIVEHQDPTFREHGPGALAQDHPALVFALAAALATCDMLAENGVVAADGLEFSEFGPFMDKRMRELTESSPSVPDGLDAEADCDHT